MKTCSDALAAHLAQGQTTLTYLWKVKRIDGTILGFTSHDVDIVFTDATDGAVTYAAASGYTASAMTQKADASADNMEVIGFLQSDSLEEADIRNGLYDDATIEIRMVNWADLTMGAVLLRSGMMGEVKLKNGAFTSEIRGIADRLRTPIGDLYGPVCRAQFGSGANGIDMYSTWLCHVDVTAYRQTGSVVSSADVWTVVPNTGLLMVGSPTPTAAAGADWFDDGIITFTSGALSGLSFEIRVWDGTTLTLSLPMPQSPAATDTFTIEPGCNHLKTDCINKYQNVANLRAEDNIPGNDQILQMPS